MPSRRYTNAAWHLASGASAFCRLFRRGRVDLRALFRCRVRCLPCRASAARLARCSHGLPKGGLLPVFRPGPAEAGPGSGDVDSLLEEAASARRATGRCARLRHVPKARGFVGQASTGCAGLQTKWSSPPRWTLVHCRSTAPVVHGLGPVARRRCPALSGCTVPRAEARCAAPSDVDRLAVFPRGRSRSVRWLCPVGPKVH